MAPGYRESAESWAAALRDLRARGLGVPKLLLADGQGDEADLSSRQSAGPPRGSISRSISRRTSSA